MNPIDQWRPRAFGDIIGRANITVVRQLQSFARSRRGFAAAFVGPFGTAKTSTARLLLQSYLCLSPDPITADPCHRCQHCQQASAEFNGTVLNYQFFDVAGNRVGDSTTLSEMLAEMDSPFWPPFLIMDELPRLPERRCQKLFLDFVNDLKEGVFIATIMTPSDHSHPASTKVLPELLDRLTTFRFHQPTGLELTDFFLAGRESWGIIASTPDVTELVTRTKGSFRQCLKYLEMARIANSGRLDRKFLDDSLPARSQHKYCDPFAT